MSTSPKGPRSTYKKHYFRPPYWTCKSIIITVGPNNISKITYSGDISKHLEIKSFASDEMVEKDSVSNFQFALLIASIVLSSSS